MTDRITKEQVEDYEAQQRGFDDRHAERLHDLQGTVDTAKFIVTERLQELREAEDAVKTAESALRSYRRKIKP